jgi:hypothetical protein
MPVLRDRARIVADLTVPPGPTATDISRATVAEIELNIRDGDDAFKQARYSAALTAFKKARALIYKALQPTFDADAFVVSRFDVALPIGKAVERQIMDTSLRMVDGMRPKDSAAPPLFGLHGDVTKSLKPFTQTGFREPVTIEGSLQWANEHAVAFLADAKPAAAVGLLTEALEAAQDSKKVDSAIAAARRVRKFGRADSQGNRAGVLEA